MTIFVKIIFVLAIALKLAEVGFSIYDQISYNRRRKGKKARKVRNAVVHGMGSLLNHDNTYVQAEQNRIFSENAQRAFDDAVRVHHEAMDTHIDIALNDHMTFMNNNF